jgi:hypothetical protein
MQGLVGLGCVALLAPAGTVLAQDCAPSNSAEIVITEPNLGSSGIASTESSTIDIKGVVVNPCSLFDIDYIVEDGNGVYDEGNAYKVTTNFVDAEDKWFFEIRDVMLRTATAAGESQENEITVNATGYNSPSYTFFVTHSVPGGSVSSEGDLNPTNSAYSKGKVTWYHLPDQKERFSTNARLIPLQPFVMPCAAGDVVTVKLLTGDPSNPLELFRQAVTGAEANTCTSTRYRETGPRGGLRDLLIEPRSDGELTTYLFMEDVEFGPSTDAFVRSLGGYTVVIQVAYADRTLEWQIELGPDVTFESISTSNGDEARTAVRYNR